MRARGVGRWGWGSLPRAVISPAPPPPAPRAAISGWREGQAAPRPSCPLLCLPFQPPAVAERGGGGKGGGAGALSPAGVRIPKTAGKGVAGREVLLSSLRSFLLPRESFRTHQGRVQRTRSRLPACVRFVCGSQPRAGLGTALSRDGTTSSAPARKNPGHTSRPSFQFFFFLREGGLLPDAHPPQRSVRTLLGLGAGRDGEGRGGGRGLPTPKPSAGAAYTPASAAPAPVLPARSCGRRAPAAPELPAPGEGASPRAARRLSAALAASPPVCDAGDNGPG